MTPKKLDFGNATEDDVQDFVEHAFGVDFVFRSPSHERGKKQKETTDVLAVWGDVAIPIQVKAQAYNSDASPRKPNVGWTKKNLKKAVSQVTGAVRTLRGEGTVRLHHIRRGTLEFDRAKTHYFYGTVVLNHVFRPFQAEELVPEIRTSGFPIHVFSFLDFYNLVRVLDTPVDLIGYLEMRADILIPTLNPRVHEEQRVFEYYLHNLEELTELRASQRGDPITAREVNPYAEALRSIYTDSLPDLRASYYVDQIISAAHEVDESISTPFEDSASGRRSDYAFIAEQLSSLMRPRRVSLGREFLDTIRRAAEKRDLAFAHASSAARDECLLFMASPRPQSQRKERNQDLYEYLLLLKTTRGVSRAMGIATEAGHEDGRSYDFIFVESNPALVMQNPNYASIKELGESVFGIPTPL